MDARLALVAATLVVTGCVTPHPGGDDRAEMVTGSNIPKRYRPGDDNVQVYKPTPADMAHIGPGMPPSVEKP